MSWRCLIGYAIRNHSKSKRHILILSKWDKQFDKLSDTSTLYHRQSKLNIVSSSIYSSYVLARRWIIRRSRDRHHLRPSKKRSSMISLSNVGTFFVKNIPKPVLQNQNDLSEESRFSFTRKPLRILPWSGLIHGVAFHPGLRCFLRNNTPKCTDFSAVPRLIGISERRISSRDANKRSLSVTLGVLSQFRFEKFQTLA